MQRDSGTASAPAQSITVNVSVLVMDSSALAMSTDLGINIAAATLDKLADFEFGRPLDYRDPTGEAATWNALIEHVQRERARIGAGDPR